MTDQQWSHVARRMGEAREKMLEVEAGEAARIFNCLEHFARACADAVSHFPEPPNDQ